jgi:hypothetical protein
MKPIQVPCLPSSLLPCFIIEVCLRLSTIPLELVRILVNHAEHTREGSSLATWTLRSLVKGLVTTAGKEQPPT